MSDVKLLALRNLASNLLAALMMAGACVSFAQSEQTAPASATFTPPTLAEFFKHGELTEVVPSPNGRYIALTMPIGERLNLVVIDVETKQSRALTNYNNIDVGRIRWVENDRLLYSAIQVGAPSGTENPRAGGLFVVSRDGSESLQLAKTARQLASGGGSLDYLAMFPVATIPGNSDEIIAGIVVANDDSVDLYRVNLTNRRTRILTAGRPSDRIQSWILDGKLVPRVAVAAAKGASTELIIFYRASNDDPWKELTRFDTTKPPAFVPLAFDDDDQTLFVASNHDRKNMAIYRYNPATKSFIELVAHHPRYDMGATPQGQSLNSIVRDPVSRKIVGFRVDAAKPETVWLDDRLKRRQATLDAALPGRTNLFLPVADGQRTIVTSFSDTDPGEVYFFDEQKRQLQLLGKTRPWLENKLAKVRPFLLKTRDGLEIPSYYVLPRNYKPGDKLSTIIHIHGGPMARDVLMGGRYGASFGVTEAQVLASRGYAVVLPNFRITPGLGAPIYYAGFGTFGKQMSDDHEDAAKWAIDQGFADPKRICISGASYGGYAALHAATRASNPFACVISGLPVTDLKFQRANADYASNPATVEYWRKLHGVKDFDDPLVRETSPLFNAEKIKIPVFMYVGEEDTRTPPAQAKKMADALKAAGNPVKDYFIGKNEWHGFAVPATNVALYERMLKFLEEALR